jgi:hypothetical protein
LPPRQKEKVVMRIPQQVSERVKEAPAQALRAVFSGIGQVLLVADRIKSRAAELQRETPPDPGPRAQAAARAQAAGPTEPAPKEESRWRSLDETGNVRLLPQEAVTGARPASTAPEAAAEAAGTTPHPAEPVAEATPEPAETAAEPVAQATPEPVSTAAEAVPEPTASAPEPAEGAPEPATPPAGTALPVPNYDELTVASLRARLRNLDSSQVQTLLDYEKENAGRPAVLTMFERRIAKLESGEA